MGAVFGPPTPHLDGSGFALSAAFDGSKVGGAMANVSRLDDEDHVFMSSSRRG
jgi:hypothetical protein